MRCCSLRFDISHLSAVQPGDALCDAPSRGPSRQKSWTVRNLGGDVLDEPGRLVLRLADHGEDRDGWLYEIGWKYECHGFITMR